MVLVHVRSRQEFIKHKSLGVNVMFTGENCPLCIQVKPYFEQMSRQHHGNFMIVDRIRLGLTDADIGFSIQVVPTFVKYKNNQVACMPFSGFDLNRLQQMITQN
jgi:hypothetical protein